MGKRKKTRAKASAAAAPEKAPVPELWRCTEPWLRNFMGRDFKKGDDILIHPNQITAAVLETLQGSFKKVTMEAATFVSGAVEALKVEEA